MPIESFSGDLNTLVTPGMYRLHSVTNKPMLADFGNCLVMGKDGDDTRTQLLGGFTSTLSGILFFREGQLLKSVWTWGKWVRIATATPPQEFDLPIADGYDGTSYPQKYCKTQEGIILLRFTVCKKVGYIEVGDVIGILPDGYRPSDRIVSIVGVDGIEAGTGIFSAEVQINPLSGEIYIFHVNDKAKWVFGEISFVQG